MNMANLGPDLEEQGKSFTEYLQIIKRRKKPMQIAAAITFGIAILAALFWPPTYRATATILIEEQEIPQDLVRSTVTGFANQQLKVISQRVLTLSNILDIVQKYSLWSDAELKRTPRTEIMKKFQKRMHLDLVSAEVMDPRFGRAVEATIAFNLSFDHGNPLIAQKVANELVNLYMNENLKTRTERSATTAEFLKNEAEALNAHIKETQEKISVFKQNNEGALPELSQYNMNVIERSDLELNDAKTRLSELQKRKLDLQANLAQVSPYAAIELPTGEKALGDHDRLKALKSEYRSKAAVYSPDHPDVLRLKREIDTLEKNLGITTSNKDDAELLRVEQAKLEQLLQSYTPDHPEVIKQQRVIASLQAKKDQPVKPDTQPAADSPAYVLLRTQLQSTEADILSLTNRIADLQEKISRFEGYLAKAPNVEKTYIELTRELETDNHKYQEIKAKQMEAELSQNLESERKGERYNLIEPPILPDEPVSPNRVLIIVLGIIFGAGVAVATAGVLESLDDSVRGTHELTELFSVAPLATIPYILLAEEQEASKSTHRNNYLIVAGAIFIMLLIIHFVFKPLDVLWYIALRKLGLG